MTVPEKSPAAFTTQVHAILEQADLESAYVKEADLVADIGVALRVGLGPKYEVVVEGRGAMAGKGYDVALFGGAGFWPDIVVLACSTDESQPAKKAAAIEVKLHKSPNRSGINRLSTALGQALVYRCDYGLSVAFVGVNEDAPQITTGPKEHEFVSTTLTPKGLMLVVRNLG